MPEPPDDHKSGDLVLRSPTSSQTSSTQSVSGTDPSIVRDFLEIAKQEIQIRQQELELQKQEKSDAHEYAKLALTEQASDRKDTRQHRQTARRDKMIVGLCAMLILGTFIVIMLYMGYERIAFEIVKDLGLVAVGAFGGAAYQRVRKTESDKDDGGGS